MALAAAAWLPAAAPAADPVDRLRGSVTLGTKAKPGPVVAFSVRSRRAGIVKVNDRRRRVRFAGKTNPTAVRGVGEKRVVGSATMKLGKRRYVLRFALTDNGRRGDRVVLQITGPRGKGSRRAGRGYQYSGKARKGNVTVGRVKTVVLPIGPIFPPGPGPGPIPGPGPGPVPEPTPEPTPEPPSPEPPAVDPTIASTVFDVSEFIYSGTGAIQTGVAPGTIEPARTAVLRGRVTDRSGAPVADVTVKVLDSPEYGQTATDSTGAYTLVVNGGDRFTLTLEKAGFVPVQRPVEPGWQRWESLETVVVTPRQETPTDVSFAPDAGDDPTVARGAAETDGDGTRRGTLLIPDDTTAEMKMPDGSTQPLADGDLRITEVTVGPDGRRAMTAPLPPESGYTYAVELSVDQAEAAGATELSFSEPLPYYTENFLGFPVGTTVPLGHYDEQRGVWVAADSGQVVKILTETGGMADVDTDGDATADDTGIGNAEREQLAALYDPGDELWRVELPHFSTWDLNWGVRPPEDARPPWGLPAPFGGGGRSGGGGPDDGFGSIDPEDQVLVEDIGLTGVGFGLAHTTRRSVGFDAARVVEVRLDDPLPGPVKRVEIEVSVAGRKMTRTLHRPGSVPPGGSAFSPGQVVTVEWDGRDAFGRALAGGQRARVRVGYTYAAEYGTTSRFGYSQGPAITASPTREDLTLWTERTESLGTIEPEAAALGGFSPSVHHTYDPIGEVLYEGGGGVRSARATAPVIETIARDSTALDTVSVNVAPDGSMTWTSTSHARLVRRAPDGTVARLRQGGGDWLGGPANDDADGLRVEQTGLAGGIRDFERAPDGTFLYIDRACRTRQIYRDADDVWRVRTMAGRDSSSETCYQRPKGDGGPAVDAGFSVFGTAAVAGHPGGGAVIGDEQRVRRVFPDGRIATMGIAAVPDQFSTSRNINDLSLDREGRVIWRTECFVGRIELDGSSTLLAGRDLALGAPEAFEEGMSALLPSACGAQGNSGGGIYGSVETGPDGAVYFNLGRRVMRIGADGALTTYAGKGTILANTGDGGPARQAEIREVGGLGFDGEGRLVIAAGYNGDQPALIRRIDAPLPGFQRTDATYRIPSEDGREVYVFGATGRHLRTRDALTGATLWEFGYDSAGRLVSADDVDGDRTTIERDGDGVATVIAGPDGDRTTLAHDAAGRLASVANPAGEATGLEWAPGDLLAAVTGPRGNRFAFTYDSAGRITRADDPPDPDGPDGFRTYARTATTATVRVTATSALGRATVHRVTRLASGASRRTVTDPAGEVTAEETATDDQTIITTPDGTVTRSTLGPDPRYGMLAPIRIRTEVDPPGTTPTATTLGARTIAGLDPLDPFAFTSLTETVSETAGTPATDDDRTATRVYTRASRTLEWRSAQSASRKLTATLDAKGRVTRIERPGQARVDFGYRADGRPASRTQAGRAFGFAYDAGGRPSSISDAAGSVTGLDHDAAGRLSSVTQPSPVGGTVALGRDANGNLDAVTTPGGEEHAFAFRPAELLSTASPPSVGADPASDATDYAHDADRALTGIDEPGAASVAISRAPASGRVTAVAATGAGSTAVSYNAAGQVAGLAAPDATLSSGFDGFLPTSQTWTGGIAGSVSRAYDADHRVASQSVAGDGAASTIDFAYDADALLTGVSGAMAATVERDAATGRVAAIESAGGPTREAWDYSAAFGERSGQTVTHAGAARYDVDYTRDALGRVTSKTERFNGGPAATSTYAYDAAGRLTSATIGGVATSYSWDQNGNRTSGGALYDAQDRLTQTAGATFTHTADGRRRSRTAAGATTSYDYDALGVVRGVGLPGTADDIAYKIDGAGQRVERRVGATVTNRWVYDDQGRIAAELDAANDLVASYAYLPGDYAPFLMRRGATTYRLVSDQVGSIRLVVDTSDGSIAQRIDYDAFGVPTYTGPQTAGFIPFGFASGHYDPATGLVRMGVRDYDPATGRFTAKDPAGFAGGYASLYAYAGGDPVNQVDPTGYGPRRSRPGDADYGSGSRDARRGADQGKNAAYGDTEDFVARVSSIGGSENQGLSSREVQVRRNGGPWMNVGEGFLLGEGDQIRTDADTLAALEFTIGGKVGINPNSSVDVVNERSVTDSEFSLKRAAARNAALWLDADAKTLKQSMEIQTNGGVFAIKG